MYHTGLGRDGPGLLLRDIRREAADVILARDTLTALAPDIVLLLDFDHDYEGRALRVFQSLLFTAGLELPHSYAPRPNSGLASGIDLDGDGRRNDPDDAQGWGRFPGAGGMAILSRWPIDTTGLRDHSALLWAELPDNRYPRVDGQPYPSPEAYRLQRLSSTGHWEVPVATPQGALRLLAWHAGPPVFGGPQGRNAARNADETLFWLQRLEATPQPFVLLGDSNLDPQAGAGDRSVMARLLGHPTLQDPAPRARLPSGELSSATAYWPNGPGALRTDYLLPSAGIRVLAQGLVWPSIEATHAVVWADLRLGG